MCCRLRIDNRELESRGGGLVRLQSPDRVYRGRHDQYAPDRLSEQDRRRVFRCGLEKLMILAKESLAIKRKVLEKFTDGKSLSLHEVLSSKSGKERFDEYWKNHFSTIGLVGMNEACLNLLGKNIGRSRQASEFTKRVLDFMRDKLVAFQQETGNNYNLEATPAEGTSYRLAKIDRGKVSGHHMCQRKRTQGREPLCLLHEFLSTARQFHGRYFRGPRSPGGYPGTVHRRHRVSCLCRRTDCQTPPA